MQKIIHADGSETALIHFACRPLWVPEPPRPFDPWQIACSPDTPITGVGNTNDPRAVTCAVCKETYAFQEAKQDLERIKAWERR